jgi:hypothetical protein
LQSSQYQPHRIPQQKGSELSTKNVRAIGGRGNKKVIVYLINHKFLLVNYFICCLTFQFSSFVSFIDHALFISSTGPQTNATAFFDASMMRDSPFLSSNRVAPSIETQAEHLPSSGFVNLIVQFSGRIKGLNDSE